MEDPSRDERSLFEVVDRWNQFRASSPNSSSDFDAPASRVGSFDAARFRTLKALGEETSRRAEQERVFRWESLTAKETSSSSETTDRSGRGCVPLPFQPSPAEELDKILVMKKISGVMEKKDEEDGDLPTLDTTVDQDDEDDCGTSAEDLKDICSTEQKDAAEAFPLSAARKETLEALAQLSQKYWNTDSHHVVINDASIRLPSRHDYSVQHREETTSDKALFAWKHLFEISSPQLDKTPHQQSLEYSTAALDSRPPLLKLASSALSGSDDESRSSMSSQQQDECAALLQLGCLMLGKRHDHGFTAEYKNQNSQCPLVNDSQQLVGDVLSQFVEDTIGSVCGTCCRALVMLFVLAVTGFVLVALDHSEIELLPSEEQRTWLTETFPTCPKVSMFLEEEDICFIDEDESEIGDHILHHNASSTARVLSLSTSSHASKTNAGWIFAYHSSELNGHSSEAFTEAMRQISIEQCCYESEFETSTKKMETLTPDRENASAPETVLVLRKSTALVQSTHEAPEEGDFDNSQDYIEGDSSSDSSQPFIDENEIGSLTDLRFSHLPAVSASRVSSDVESAQLQPIKSQEEAMSDLLLQAGRIEKDDHSFDVLVLPDCALAQQAIVKDSRDTESMHHKHRLRFWRKQGSRLAQTISKFFRGRRQRPLRNKDRITSVHTSGVQLPNTSNSGPRPLEGADDEFLRVPLSQVVATFFEERTRMGLD